LLAVPCRANRLRRDRVVLSQDLERREDRRSRLQDNDRGFL